MAVINALARRSSAAGDCNALLEGETWQRIAGLACEAFHCRLFTSRTSACSRDGRWDQDGRKSPFRDCLINRRWSSLEKCEFLLTPAGQQASSVGIFSATIIATHWRRLRLPARTTPWLYIEPVLRGVKFLSVTQPQAVCLTFVLLNLQLKFCLYTTVHILPEFRNSVKLSLSAQSVCHTISPRFGVLNFVTPDSKSNKNKDSTSLIKVSKQ